MIDERQEELAALAALDLLEGAEKAQFEGEMTLDAELRQRVQQLREAASKLVHVAPQVEPPAGLKDRILASAGHHRQEAAPERLPTAKILPFRLIFAWAAAACLALSTAGITQLYFSARARNSILEDQGRAADLELKSLQTRVDAERLIDERRLAEALRAGDLAQMKIAALTSMLGNSPEAVAVAVWNPARQEGVMAVDKLPAADASKDYELWVIPPGAKPVAAGLVKTSMLGKGQFIFHADKPVDAVAKFAITLEKKGGGSAPAGPLVLLSQ
ncbi:MAG TPA: anti-sigma factor [Opitutaceae bacterium]|jgi:anti-sigma-K factor RskA